MRRTNTSLSLATLIGVGFLLVAGGCSSLKTTSSLEKQVLEPPSEAFMKRVKNDPFPSASEQTYVPPKNK